MGTVKTTNLPAGSVPVDADLVPVEQPSSGTLNKVTMAQLRAYLGNTIRNQSTGAQALTAATRTYLTNSNLAVPVGKLRIGTVLRWRFNITKTAAGVATSSIAVVVGTLGTTGDTDRIIFTKPAGSAVADEGWVEIEAIVRGPLSAAGIVTAEITVTHNLAATGHMLQQQFVANLQSAGFDVTVANLIVGLTMTTGAADAVTIQQLTAEAYNL